MLFIDTLINKLVMSDTASNITPEEVLNSLRTPQDVQDNTRVAKHCIETQAYNDNDITTLTATSTESVQTSSWKDWFAYISNNSNPDIDNTSYAGNTIDDKVKNAAEYFGNNVFTLEVEKFSLIRCS